MANPAGTPLWLTLLLQFVTAAGTLMGTHFLTSRRERTKKHDERVKDWRQQQVALLSEIVELARDHYSNPGNLPGTQVNALRIISKLKKFRSRFQDMIAIVSTDSAEANRLYVQLNDLITGPDDFQYADRNERLMNDHIFDAIEGCEEALRRNINKERTVKK